MKQNIPYSIESSTTLKLNKLCSEDQNNEEIKQTISERDKSNPPFYIHRKAWEFAMAEIALKRLNKLNMKS